jgi:nitrite reductase/ring-hydroxylating ferredoxin subunit
MSDTSPTRPARFAGYFRRAVPAPDAELTRVGPGTPCGEWLRRAWQPVALASELTDVPLAVRILDEDLVLFRDLSRQLGLLHRHCSHRGASLEYGVPQQRGLACCYHGWHYDIDGALLATPAEPTDRLRTRVVHGAYPVREQDGLIFAYLGPPDRIPEPPTYDTQAIDDTQAIPFALDTPCNWLQVYENTQDPVHVVYLHTRMSGAQFGDASGAEQVIDYRETPLGMVNVQTRRWRGHYWTRLTESILPNGNQTGAIWEAADRRKIFQRASMLRWMVPIDDTHTRTIGWRFFRAELDPHGLGNATEVGKGKIDFVGQTEDERPYRERQRQPGDYEVQVSQRPIAVHALENLGASDRGVAMLRRLIRQGIRNPDALLAAAPPAHQGVLATYCQDTVWPVGEERPAHASTLAAVGAAVAESVIGSGAYPERERRAKLARVLTEHLERLAR